MPIVASLIALALAAEATAPATTAPPPAPPLHVAWSKPGNWLAVDADRTTGSVLAWESASDKNRVAEIDASGSELVSVSVPNRHFPVRLLRVVRRGEQKRLLVFGGPRLLSAWEMTGEKSWEKDLDDPLDDLATDDLDNDGRDEVVLGLQGGGGVQVLDTAGKLLWGRENSCGFTRVWAVATGDVDGDRRADVVEGSHLAVLRRPGTPIQTFWSKAPSDGPLSASHGLTVARRPGRRAAQVLVGAGLEDLADHHGVTAVDADTGKVLWHTEVEVPRYPGRLVGRAARTQPWVAYNSADVVRVVSAVTGVELGRRVAGGAVRDLAWTEVGATAKLVVATDAGLVALEVPGNQ